jgi:oligosaccharyltransferase complex subunit delta (ribophorin II)
LSKKALSALSDGKFEFNFLEQKRERGFYKLTLSAQSTDTRLVGTKGEVTVKVLTEVTVEGVELSVVDREQASTSNIAKLQYPSKFATPLEADSHQKILMKFTLKDKATNTPVRVHQAFIAFSKVDTKQEIVFVAEPDSAKVYKFDVDLQKSSKDFDFLSGKYSMKMIVGDAVISNPFVWHLADINLKFAEQDKPKPSGKAVIYKPLPEIKHLFREPEKRPPGVVSDTFTILALVPLAVLLILWLRIGINFWNFSLSPASLGYHIGLGAIFGLYFMFWWKLNMFVTLKYLAGIGGVTFIAGNAMLRGMANRRKAKSE